MEAAAVSRSACRAALPSLTGRVVVPRHALLPLSAAATPRRRLVARRAAGDDKVKAAAQEALPIEKRFPPFPSVLDINQIREILPHRFPFLLVDRVIEYKPGEYAVGIKNVTINDNFFPGHFPERPIMPGVLMVEAMAQVGGLVMLQPEVGGSRDNFFFAGIDKVRFRKPVIAGDTLVMRMTLTKFQKRFGVAKMEGKAYVGGDLVCEGPKNREEEQRTKKKGSFFASPVPFLFLPLFHLKLPFLSSWDKRLCDLAGFRSVGEEEESCSAMALSVSLVRISLLLLVVLPFCASHAPRESHKALDSDKYVMVVRRSIFEAPVDINVTTNSSFVLAADRTYRKDPLDRFRKYTRGWNISEVHYWASVGLTAFPLFIIALVWFVFFFLVMLGICCHHCCCPHHSYTYSRTAYALSLILLILFTCAAIAGCIMLYDGQGKFHTSTTTTLKFVVSQANFTVDNLRNLSDSLSAAKKVDIARVLLPPDVQNQINELQGKLNSSATDLAIRTTDNSKKIQKSLNQVRVALIIIAAVMLLLAFIGFLLSIFGLEFLVSVLVVIGWILVTGTFILCGVFLLLHNVVADTCVAMDEWVAHPTEHTALDDIIPCVEPATANESLSKSRQVTFQLVNLVNQVIVNVSNRNFPPVATPFYYNQSGPLMPTLCNPFTPDLNNRTCTSGEVTLDNATQVWKGFECQTTTVSGAEICTTVGRVTPGIYGQMAAGVNVSQGLYQYGPFLIQLEDCTFVRDTFTDINQNYCPGLERYSRWVYVGLVMVSASVMLSLVFWVIYARERRHRVYNKQHTAEHGYAKDDKPVPTGAND